MEVLLGFTGRDYTIIASSKAAMRGATILKASDDKTRQLNDHTVMAYSGEAGDTVQFAEYIQANIALYTTRNAYTLSPASIAAFVRNELARSLRSRNPYTVNLLLGGVDVPTDPLNTSPQSNPTTGPSTTTGGTSNTTSGTTTTSTTTSTGDTNAPAVQAIDSAAAKDSEKKVKPRLYWLDYLASCAPVPYAAHGYAQYYCLSILDKHHHPDIDLETGMKLLRMCSDELKRRLPIDFKGLTVKVVDGKGVREVEFEESVGVKSA